MAPSALPKPGSKYGPCEDECEHRDCAATRALAEAPCTWCGLPIGYDALFYRGDTTDDVSHAFCAERQP